MSFEQWSVVPCCLFSTEASLLQSAVVRSKSNLERGDGGGGGYNRLLPFIKQHYGLLPFIKQHYGLLPFIKQHYGAGLLVEVS